jgi:tight adherence protein C
VILLFVLGITLIGSALLMLSMALRSNVEIAGINKSIAVLEAMNSAPSALTKDLDRPFSERVLDPLLQRFVGVGRRISGSDTGNRIRRRLELAGNPPGWSVDRVVSAKAVCAIFGFVTGLLFAFLVGKGLPVTLVIVIGLLAVGFYAPNLYLYQRCYDRQEKMHRSLPDAIDLLTISVESGLGFDAAIQQVARNTSGPLADEFARVLREMQIGQGRSEALRALAERSTLAVL